MAIKIIETQQKVPDDWINHGTNLVYFGDFHHRMKPPATRIDDFKASQLNKVKQIRAIAQKYHAKALLQPGDFLDRPKLPESFLTEIMSAWGFPQIRHDRRQYDAGSLSKEAYVKKTLDYIPMVAIAGNHELYGGSIKRIADTSLAFLAKAGFLTIVSRDHPYLIKNHDLTIAITGESYDVDLLSAHPDVKRFMPATKFGDIDIFMVHEALYNTQFAPNMNWLPLETIWNDTKADITIAGHIHAGFGWIEHNHKWFGNPGAIAQQSAAESELERQICVSLIHINDDKTFAIRDIPLDLPEPKTIFDLSAKDEQEANLAKLNQVQQLITSVPKTEAIDATGIINDVAKTNKVPRRAREIALKAYHQVTQANDTTVPIDPKINYNIKRITLHNFEAYQNTTINLAPNQPTLLIGESSQGKSSVLRALYWILENKGDSKQFIRHYPGIKRAEVTLERQDGLQVTRFAQLSKTGKRITDNGYLIVTPDGQERKTNTEGLAEVQRLFGLNYLAINAHDQLPINFLKQEDGWFFIGASPANRAQIIGALYGTQYIAGTIKKLATAKRSQDAKKQLLTKQHHQTQQQLADYSNAEANNELAHNLSKQYQTLEQQNQKLILIKNAGRMWQQLVQELSQAKHTALFAQGVSELASMNQANIKSANRLNQLNKLTHDYQTNQSKLQRKQTLIAIPITTLSNKLIQLKQVKTDLIHLQEYQKYQSASKQANSAVKTATKIIDFEHAKQTIRQLQEHDRILRQAKSQFKTIKAYEQRLATIANEQINAQAKLAEVETKQTQSTNTNQLNLGTMVIFGVKTMDNYEQKLDEYTQQIDELKDIINKAKAEASVAEKQKALAEDELRKLGVDPKNATAEIDKLQQTLDHDIKILGEQIQKAHKAIVPSAK